MPASGQQEIERETGWGTGQAQTPRMNLQFISREQRRFRVPLQKCIIHREDDDEDDKVEYAKYIMEEYAFHFHSST